MRAFLLCLIFTFTGTLLLAQPANDDCGGLVDLGIVPACPDDLFTNVDATASDIGFGNSPACFNGGTTQNDVWFSFMTTTDIVDITVRIVGSPNGPNGLPITNPQIAIYRGDCVVDGLAELACISAPNGETQIQLDLLGLTPNETYFVRVNDYSASATPNWGDFTVCVEEYVPAIVMGESESSTACFGTLYDSGGPDEDYGNNENLTFTICPNDIHSCILLEFVDFNIEQLGPFFGDVMNVYGGPNTNAPLIAQVSGVFNGQGFPIQATSDCVTIEFISDDFTVSSGFEMTWQCTPIMCDGSTVDNPTVIGSLPFNGTGLTTCDGAATFASSPCTQGDFLGGPEYVFQYDSPGDLCAEIQVTGAAGGTGVLVLDGPPDDPGTNCVAQSTSGSIAAANFQDPGTYYIVVANAQGCTDFDISLEEADCALSPALVDALCNPLNGCIEEGGVPSIFNFEDGFQDLEIVDGVNDGCWLGVGVEPDFYWFSIEAQANGPFGFILESGDIPSDIDFSVWGPFTQQEVCETPNDVIEFIETNQPIRSSWAAGADPTGLADIHPVLGTPVEDEYDCGDFPGAGGDDFVSTIAAMEGETYVVLVNDWGNQIGDAGISVDWNPSEPEVLAPIAPMVLGGDTAVCIGEPVQILIQSGINSIQWIEDVNTLSCLDCLDPIATPTETTIYRAVVDAVCYTDTVEVRVVVFDANAGPDVTICRGETYGIEANSNYEDAAFEWNAPPEVVLSCTDCPNPEIMSEEAGTYTLTVTLITPNCTLEDDMTVTVLPFDAPDYGISDDLEICNGESVMIGGADDPNPAVTYAWTSLPAGFVSAEANPEVDPSENTTYFLTVVGGACPQPIVDSVLVEVFQDPVIEIAGDTAICQEVPIVLGSTTIESDVEYMWSGPATIEDPTNPNSVAFPENPGTYTLTATRGACEVVESFDVTITEIAVDILPNDTLQICRGEEVNLTAITAPDGAVANWVPNDGSLSTNTGNDVIATPQTATTYYATVEVPGCMKTDSITILVDSLPANLDIMPSDTMICQGEIVILQTPVYEPSDFPDIDILWSPGEGAQSGDSLLNYVVQPNDTITYQRIATNGVCIDTSFATVFVTPANAMTIMPQNPMICEGESVQLMLEAPDGIEELEWTPATGLSCTDCLDPTATPGSSITYTAEAEFGGCPLSASVTIQVQQDPVVLLNTNPEVCEGESIQLNFEADQTSTYTWTSPEDPDFMSNDPLLVVMPTQNMTYQLVAENECGTFEGEVSVAVVPESFAEIPEGTTICEGDVIELTVPTNAPDGVSEVFSWEYDGNQIFGQTVTIDNITSSTVINFTYIYGPECGSQTATIPIDVIPQPVVSLTNTSVICLGESVELNTDSDDISVYTWTSTDPTFGTSNEPQPVVSPTETATYFLTVDNGSCEPTDFEVTIEVIGTVNLSVMASADVICLGDEVTLTATAEGGSTGDTYSWTTDTGDTFSGPEFTDTPDETTTYNLTYITGANCDTLTESVTVEVNQGLTVDEILVDPEDYVSDGVPLGETITLTAVTTPADIPNATYVWFANGEQLSQTGRQITVSEVLEGTVFSVVVTNVFGCSDDQEIDLMVVDPEWNIPNVFTPNNDDQNDIFRVVSRGIVEVIDFRIYNRWGQIVFDNDSTEGWDGTHNGNPAPSDVYVFKVVVQFADGRTQDMEGDVTLLR